MSISSAMLAGVTGLVSNSSALAAISDNIANSNTVGYKRVGVDFTSLVNTGATGEYAAGVHQRGEVHADALVADRIGVGDVIGDGGEGGRVRHQSSNAGQHCAGDTHGGLVL